MPGVRIGRPTFVGDTLLAAAAGAAIGFALLLGLAAAARRGWSEPVGSALESLFVFYLVGLLMRLALHGVHHYVHAEMAPEHENPREDLLRYTRPLLWLGAAGGAAGAVLVRLG